jgi:hypothetical protein
MAPFVLEVAYSQISAFQSGLKDPFNDWTDRHVAQGFAWRPGSVSFRTLDGEGPISVTVTKTTAFEPSPSALRVIQVPIRVAKEGALEIATITDSVEIEMKEGEYVVVFEHGRDDKGVMWCVFHFTAQTGPAGVLRADPELAPGPELLMEARPASP